MTGFDRPLQDLVNDAKAYADLQVSDLKLKITQAGRRMCPAAGRLAG